MSAFTEKVIGKIRREGITPDAGWKFAMKRSLLWIAIVLSVGLGALSLSMTVFSLSAIDRSPFTIPPEKLFSFALFRSLPFLWIGLLTAFSALAVFEFRNTRHGYRHRTAAVAVISGIIIISGASILSAWGADERAERMMRDRVPGYAEMTEMRELFWSRPEEGFLSGTIEHVDPGTISITDHQGNEWDVTVREETIVRPMVRLEEGSTVKALGRKKTDGTFEAEDIRPWERPKDRSFQQKREHPDGWKENRKNGK